MADPVDKISQLKIDRSAPASAGRSWLLPGAALAIVGIIVIGWMFFGREATVSSKVTGKVIEVFVEEGMRVEKDQVVARLDDSTQQAQLSLARAQAESSRAALQEIEAELRNARLERDRLRDLAKRKLTSQASVDAADATFDQLAARLETGRENVKVAVRNVELARDSLSNMTIKAPFAGMVVSKNAQPGEMISPISAGGGFTRTGICTIKAGQSVSATLDAYSEWRIPAEVIAIIPTADRQKATVKVRIGFLERDERVLRDMGVKVAFLGTDTQADTPREIGGVMIAGEALRSDASGDFVWLVRNDIVEKHAVQVGGQRDRPQVLIVNGLNVGDTIVRSSEAPLVEGRSIKTN